MGLFGGDDNRDSDQHEQSNSLIDKQIADNNAELEQKRINLTEQRMSIIKSMGAEDWTPNARAPKPTTSLT